MKGLKECGMRRFVAFAVLAALGGATAALAIVNGTVDTVHNYVGAAIIPNVFGLTGFTGGNGFVWCSGTLVAPRVFLTAAHCLQPFGHYVSLGQVLVTFDATNISAPPPDARQVSSIVIMPGFQALPQGELPDPNDLGVIILAQPVHNITPVRLAPIGFLDSFPGLSKTTVSLIGYGLNEQLVLTGNRLIGTANFVNLSDTWFKYSPGTCTFDDGGPTLLVDGPTEYQIGFHSTITSDTGHGTVVDGCGRNGYDTRVDTAAAESLISATDYCEHVDFKPSPGGNSVARARNSGLLGILAYSQAKLAKRRIRCQTGKLRTGKIRWFSTNEEARC